MFCATPAVNGSFNPRQPKREWIWQRAILISLLSQRQRVTLRCGAEEVRGPRSWREYKLMLPFDSRVALLYGAHIRSVFLDQRQKRLLVTLKFRGQRRDVGLTVFRSDRNAIFIGNDRVAGSDFDAAAPNGDIRAFDAVVTSGGSGRRPPRVRGKRDLTQLLEVADRAVDDEPGELACLGQHRECGSEHRELLLIVEHRDDDRSFRRRFHQLDGGDCGVHYGRAVIAHET